MTKLALVVCFILGVTTLNVVRGEPGDELPKKSESTTAESIVTTMATAKEPELEPAKKYDASVAFYTKQCDDFLEPYLEKINSTLALNVGSESISEQSIFGPLLQCSKSFMSAVVNPLKSVLRAMVAMYSNSRAYFDGMADCVKTNGVLAPIALPVCFTQYSAYVVKGTVQSQVSEAWQAVQEVVAFATGDWLVKCLPQNEKKSHSEILKDKKPAQ